MLYSYYITTQAQRRRPILDAINTRDTMDSALRRPTGNLDLDSSRPRRGVHHQDRNRPVSRVAQLQHQSEEGDIDFELRQDQQNHQSDRRASNAPRQRHSPFLLNNRSPSPLPSPLYQTVIPAFHPNHYDLSTTNVCLCIPLTIKTPLKRWRQRRRSAKEFRARDEELRTEYARLKQIETDFRGDLPAYEQARKNGIHVRNEGVKQPQTAAVPTSGLNQRKVVNAK